MSVTVREIYDQVCYALLENGGLILGLVTEAQFLEALGEVMLDFSQKCPLDKLIYTQRIVSGTAEYTVPERIEVPELCFIGGKLIERTSEPDLTQGHFKWKGRAGVPEQWHEDDLPVKQVRVTPKPDYTGTVNAGTYGEFDPAERNLTMVGAAAPTKTAWAIGDTLDGIDDIFTHYLVYGVLEKVFDDEGENRDTQRALYCHTRYQEGVAIANAILEDELLEEED